MSQPRHLKALLYPDGSLSVHSDLVPRDATWQALGRVQHAGESQTFIRIDVARISWTALVPTQALAATPGPIVVTLTPQLPASRDALTGWPLFS